MSATARNHGSNERTVTRNRIRLGRGTYVAADVRRVCRPGGSAKERTMLETIAIILIVLWLLGMVSGYTLGNFIYILLIIAIVLFLVRLISGRRV
jgi:low affinity Fe/Cu permease